MKKLILLIFIISSHTLTAQNVGIGTTTPLTKLHVSNGASGATPFTFSPLVIESNGHTYINLLSPAANETAILFGQPGSSANGSVMYNNTSTPNGFQFRNNGNLTRMVIDNAGNVGIGTVTPAFKLEITHNGASTYGTGILINQDVIGNSDGPKIQFKKTMASTKSWTAGILNGVDISTFAISEDGGTGGFGTPRFSIVQGGNVGIGTTAPLALLHVADSSVLFSALGDIPATIGNTPISGGGRRMMWYADKAAFRVGYVDGTQWNKSNIGDYSFAGGLKTIASGMASVAMGTFTIASGDFSTAMGYGPIASGTFSTAMGDYTIASGANSTAMGNSTTALGNTSTAMGSSANAAADYSVAIGESVTANSYISTTLGRLNDPIVTSPTNTWVITEPLLIVGNGTSPSDKKNALVVQKNGKIYIDPSDKNIGDASANALVFGQYNVSGEGIASKRTSTGNQWGLDFFTQSQNRMSITNAGNIGIGTSAPTQKLQVNGNICYTGSIAACSDIRYKKNIMPLTNVLNIVLSLHGVYYKWDKEKFKDKAFTDERQIGFSAQEIEKYLPEIVQTDVAGYKAVDYSRLTPLLVEAIKEQQTQIDELKILVQKLIKQ